MSKEYPPMHNYYRKIEGTLAYNRKTRKSFNRSSYYSGGINNEANVLFIFGKRGKAKMNHQKWAYFDLDF